ncbi:MAG: VCBS repeat-containing protein [Acidobacteriota bacterium]|nr:VCBS repeat-containing protein [Acidobacteriota bacterium]
MKSALLFFLTLPSCLVPACTSAQAAVEIQKPSTPIQFVDVTTAAGIKWNLKTLAPGTKDLIETMGGGGGFIDYNGDGLLDIYLVCYSQTPQPDGASKLRDVLYRNNGDGIFTDVTESAGISNSMLGMGLTVGDYNNDGRPDMYITGYGASKLYRNDGNGKFTDVTAQASVDNKEWGTSGFLRLRQ